MRSHNLLPVFSTLAAFTLAWFRRKHGHAPAMKSARALPLLCSLALLAIPLRAQTIPGGVNVPLTGGSITATSDPDSSSGVDTTSFFAAPGYTITNLVGDEGGDGIGYSCVLFNGICTPAVIASVMVSYNGLVDFPPNGAMQVNGQTFGMWGFPSFGATNFNSLVEPNGSLTVWGSAAAGGSIGECNLLNDCFSIPNEVIFVFGSTKWQYNAHLSPDELYPGTYDFQFMVISSLNTTSTTLTAAPNPSTFGQTVTLTAIVTPLTGGIPTGTVGFNEEGTTNLGQSAVNRSGVATFTISSLTVGQHSFTATYSGDDSFTPSTSPVLTQQVNSRLSRCSRTACD